MDGLNQQGDQSRLKTDATRVRKSVPESYWKKKKKVPEEARGTRIGGKQSNRLHHSKAEKEEPATRPAWGGKKIGFVAATTTKRHTGGL